MVDKLIDPNKESGEYDVRRDHLITSEDTSGQYGLHDSMLSILAESPERMLMSVRMRMLMMFVAMFMMLMLMMFVTMLMMFVTMIM
eukprot:CAMPEP_0177666002 /NCGR_PEP_ID=MMETSP0447-20121125/21352_1 /TAXON_ID=0 /ORGANISM="Stygamoeba regulata, Strain BSH-02190019" /LENGTH=85 /DNA_ID=CAMNT_0019172127 /DNA_START=346 /DNA_END=601 /DNA_ORIENTATION=-